MVVVKLKWRILSVLLLLFVVVSSPVLAKENSKDDQLHVIPIAMATDNNYVEPTLVAMTSMLENKAKDTRLDFYLMISGMVTQKNKNSLKKLQKLYNNCSVKLIDMKNRFSSNYIAPSHITTPTYYRLCLPSLLPQIDKILYLDGDIVVTRDLWQLYNTNLEDSYIAGVKAFGQQTWVLNKSLNYAQKLGVRDLTQCINAGVLLMNLKQMRKDNLENKFNKYVPTLKKRGLVLNDQDVLNAVCYDKIKFLSPIYNAFQHVKFSYYNMPILIDCYEPQEFKEACLNPAIIHYTSSKKPWKSSKCRFYDKWKKYHEILKSKLKK